MTEPDDTTARATETDPGASPAAGAGSSLPPGQLDEREADGPDGTAAGDPLAGVTITEEDAATAVVGVTDPDEARSAGTVAPDDSA